MKRVRTTVAGGGPVNEVLCGSSGDESMVFDVLTKDDAHAIDI